MHTCHEFKLFIVNWSRFHDLLTIARTSQLQIKGAHLLFPAVAKGLILNTKKVPSFQLAALFLIMCSQLCLVVLLATALCTTSAASSAGHQLDSILSLLGMSKPTRNEVSWLALLRAGLYLAGKQWYSKFNFAARGVLLLMVIDTVIDLNKTATKQQKLQKCRGAPEATKQQRWTYCPLQRQRSIKRPLQRCQMAIVMRFVQPHSLLSSLVYEICSVILLMPLPPSHCHPTTIHEPINSHSCRWRLKQMWQL